MSSYSKVKSISKILIYFSVFSLLISGGVFFISRNKIGADSDTNMVATIKNLGGENYSVIASGLEGSEFNDNLDDFNNRHQDIYYHKNDDIECSPVNRSSCFSIRAGNWSSPSIDEKEYNPTWDFIKQSNAYFQSTGGEELRLMQVIKDNYVAAAWNDWKDDNLRITTTDENNGEILLVSQEFFEALSKSGINAQNEEDNYCQPTGHCELQISGENSNYNNFLKIKLQPKYEGAKLNSVWLAGVDFILGSIVRTWEENGLDLSDIRELLAGQGRHRDQYLSDANRISKDGQILSVNIPYEFYLKANSANSMQPKEFVAYTDLSKADTNSQNQYKVKVYVKPESKVTSNPAVLIGPFAITSSQLVANSRVEFKYSWDQDIINKSYDPAPSDSGDVSYDFSFGQKYKITTMFVEYSSENPSGKEIERVESNFNTISATSGGAISDSNDYFDFDASPSQLNYGDTLSVDINFKEEDPSKPLDPPISDLDNVDASLCVGRKSATVGTNCPVSIGSASSDKQRESLSWTVPDGYSIGYYTAQGKGFFDGYHVENATGYDELTVSNNDPSLSEDNPISSEFSGWLNFGQGASKNKRGSSITDIAGLVERIIKIFLSVIGALSIIAIIIGGIFYITSGGDPDKAKRGQKTVVYAIYGIALSVLAWVIEYAVLEILEKIGLIKIN